MTNYQVHPEPFHYGVELRAGESVDDYIATARGFRSAADWCEYRDATPRRQAAIRRDRDNSSADSDDDRRRQLEFLRIVND